MFIDGMFIGGIIMFLGVLLGASIRSRKEKSSEEKATKSNIGFRS